jgi:hypothetical protein
MHWRWLARANVTQSDDLNRIFFPAIFFFGLVQFCENALAFEKNVFELLRHGLIFAEFVFVSLFI